MSANPDPQAPLVSPGRPGNTAFETEWRDRFEEFAADRDDDAGIAGWSPSGLDARMRRFAGLWHAREPGQRWLDAGCGAGTYTRFLRERGAAVVGVDYSPPTILKARARSPGEIDYLVADVRRLPFRPGTFDGTLCFGVVQALGHAEPAIRELALLTAPRGQLWVDALNRWCVANAWEVLRRRLAGRPMHLRYESAREIKRIMIAQGLVDVKLCWMPILPRRWQGLQRAIETPVAQWVISHVPLVGSLSCHAFIVCGKKDAAPAP